MGGDKEYHAEHFQMLKDIDVEWYENKKCQNRAWNKTEVGRKWKRDYMREYQRNRAAQKKSEAQKQNITQQGQND